MSLEKTIRETIIAESMDLDGRLQQLVRAGLMPSNTLPLLRRAITKMQSGMTLQGPERDVMATFINSMMFIVLGDDAIFNRARVGAKGYAAEEVDMGQAERGMRSSSRHTGGYHVVDKAGKVVSKHANQGSAMRAALNNNDHRVKAVKEELTTEATVDTADIEKKKMISVNDKSKISKLAAMMKSEKKPVKEESEQIDEISKKTLASYSDKAVRQTHGNQPHGKDALRKRTNREQGVKAAYNKFFGYKTKVPATEETQIDELSQDKLSSYRKAARKQGSGPDTGPRKAGYNLAGRKVNPGLSALMGKAPRVAATEETQIDELSKDTMGRYIKKAADRMSTQGVTAGLKIAKDEKSQKNFDNISKRARGISTAVKKLTKESRRTEALADISAIKQMNESYKTTFDAALETYGIKSPSELDENTRKEFFNFVDQEYKKGDK